jgi:hypothetical protein
MHFACYKWKNSHYTFSEKWGKWFFWGRLHKYHHQSLLLVFEFDGSKKKVFEFGSVHSVVRIFLLN